MMGTWAALQTFVTIEIMRPRSRTFVDTTWRGPEAPEVALTFDDGPHLEDTPRFLDHLAARGARGTFFFVGQRARQNQGLVRRVVAEGYDIGTHSATHPWWFAFAGTNRLRAEVIDAARDLEQIAGRPVSLFRPPMGHRGPLHGPVLAGSGLRVVTWSGRPFDTFGGSPERIAEATLRAASPGAILVLHEGVRRATGATSPSAAALPAILAGLEQRALTPVTLTRLLRAP